VTVKAKPFVVVPYTIRNNDIVRFESPAPTTAAYLQEVKDDFDVLYLEAAHRRRMMSISTHDRISGIPGRVKLIEEFITYAQKQKGVLFMRKDEMPSGLSQRPTYLTRAKDGFNSRAAKDLISQTNRKEKRCPRRMSF
jgi:hypothetical protein